MNKTNMIKNLHDSIKYKFDSFIENNNIPNIILYGPYGSGKTTLLHYLLQSIYKNIDNANEYIMYINCAFGKGIKFIREELKLFAKTNICSHSQNEPFFKSVVLLHADNLTIDAQSALRRCIEVFSFNTRFFILVNHKYRLIEPILSRFCEIYIPNPVVKHKSINLHEYNSLHYKKSNQLYKKITYRLSKIQEYNNLIELAYDLYNIGCSTIIFIDYVKWKHGDNLKTNEYVFDCEYMRINIRFEVMSLYLCLEKYKLRFLVPNEI